MCVIRYWKNGQMCSILLDTQEFQRPTLICPKGFYKVKDKAKILLLALAVLYAMPIVTVT